MSQNLSEITIIISYFESTRKLQSAYRNHIIRQV